MAGATAAEGKPAQSNLIYKLQVDGRSLRQKGQSERIDLGRQVNQRLNLLLEVYRMGFPGVK